MSIDQPESQLKEPFIINYVAGRYLIFSVETLKHLREVHHICGTLIGTLPQISQQNVFLGLPQQIMIEEAAYLVRHGHAYIVDEKRVHDQTVSTITPSELEQHKSDRRQREARKDAASQQLKEQRRREVLEKKGLSHLLADSSLETKSVSSDVAHGSRLQTAHIDTVSPSIIYRPPPASAPLDDSIQPNPSEDRYNLFVHLHERGYFMTPGLRFGAQFNAYPGDPLRFHSHFVASGHDWDTPIPVMDIVAGGRLGTGVKKAWLVGAENPDNQSYECYTVEWAGM